MSFFATLKDIFAKGIREPSTTFSFAMIRPKAAGNYGGNALAADASYVAIDLVAMHVSDKRFIAKEYYPVVHSFVGIARASEGRVEVPYVAGPDKLSDLDKGSQDLVLSENIALLKPTPYIGGSVDVAIALCAAVAKDYLQNLLGILGSLSGVIGGSTLTSALNVVGPLKDAAEALLGTSGDVVLKIGVINSFSQAAPVADGANPNPDESALLDGLYAFAHIDVTKGLAPWFSFKDSQLFVDYSDGARPVTEDYVVFRIRQLAALEEWASMADLDRLAKDVKEAALKGDLSSADFKDAMAKFKMAVIESRDLIELDRKRIIAAVQRMASDYADSPPVAALSGDSDSALLQAMKVAPSPAEASALDLQAL